MIENNFGINWQALAVLSNLQSRDGLESSWNGERYEARVQAAPWYNGRERGVVFYLRHESGHQLNIAVFEHRIGEHICAAEWDGLTFNPPTLNDMPKGKFDGSNWTEEWDYGVVSHVADWVYDRFEKFWTARKKKAVA